MICVGICLEDYLVPTSLPWAAEDKRAFFTLVTHNIQFAVAFWTKVILAQKGQMWQMIYISGKLSQNKYFLRKKTQSLLTLQEKFS